MPSQPSRTPLLPSIKPTSVTLAAGFGVWEGGPSGTSRRVQTFLPYADFRRSARALDPRRLGKQRVEALQVLRAVGRITGGWVHHPAVRMWRPYPEALARYGLEVCDAWLELGFADTCAAKIVDDVHTLHRRDLIRTQEELAQAGELPPWLGDERVHRSHRSALLRKDPAFYGPIFGDEPDDLPYHWPA